MAQVQTPLQYYQSLTTPGATAGPATPIGVSSKPDKPEPTSNLPFDPRIYRRNKIMDQNVQVGSISTQPFTPGDPVYTCYFLFNPNEIDKAYAFDSTIPLPPDYLQGSAGSLGQGTLLNQSISFTLLFDRTFEAWAGPSGGSVTVGDYSGPGPYKFGAQWDVWAVERLVGVFGQAYYPYRPSGPPLAQICTVTFGDPNNPQSASAVASGEVASIAESQRILGRRAGLDPSDFGYYNAGNGGALSFDGWMQSLEVQYTRFDADMTPTRAAVAVSFQIVYSLPGVGATDNAPADTAGTTGGAGAPAPTGGSTPNVPVEDNTNVPTLPIARIQANN